MNFACTQARSRKKIMQEGDLVILYERHDSMSHFYLHKSQTFQNKFGRFPHSEMIGKQFGFKIKSTSYDGYVYVLEPTPDLWSHALLHRTQIVDSSDASFVALQLDLYPGCVVVESGTGSGNMTVNFARAIAPGGQIHTFEYNADRASMAVAEFEKIGLASLVTVKHGDVCGSPSVTLQALPSESQNSESESTSVPVSVSVSVPGMVYGFDGVGDSTVDAVFLDVPAPWLAVGHAKRVLKPGRRVCTYSPCIEQVMKTCDRLRELGFHSIKMLEVRQRQFDGRIVSLATPDLGEEFISPLPVSSQNAEVSNTSNTNNEESSDHANNSDPQNSSTDTICGSKRASEDTNQQQEMKGEGEDEGEGDDNTKRRRNAYEVTAYPPTSVTVARAMGGMKGHTAFLTFAICPEKHCANDGPDNL